MADYGGFNHNYQSYRVVSELENRYPEWPGLNLTHETLEGLAKHETEYDISDTVGFDVAKRASLEAQIANVVDELAYNTHDLDDGLQSGLLTPDQLTELEIWRRLCDRLRWESGPMDEITRHRFIREMVGMEVDDVLKATAAHLDALQPQSTDDVQHNSENLVTYSEDLQRLNRELKDFLFQNMYRHFRVIRMQKRAELFVTRIFESCVAEPRLMPQTYQARLEEEALHRVVADYIASMTDRSALLEYRRLFDPMMRSFITD